VGRTPPPKPSIWNWRLVLALTGSSREHPNGEGFSANLFDGLTGQAKPASEGDERTPILTHRERTRQGPPDLFGNQDS